MEVQLDYQRMADAVYALAALRALETGAENRMIGRDEEEALLRRFEWALTEICLRLGSAVKELDARRGRAVIEPGGDMVYRALEWAVQQTVLADLGLTRDSPAGAVALLQRLVAVPPPYLSRN